MQDRDGLIKNGFKKAGISFTDALSMEYLKHDNPFDEHVLWS